MSILELKSLEFEDELQKWETEYKKGFSKPFILLTLGEKPNYPYQVTKTIIGKTKGQIAIAGSNIYPILKTLEDNGLILGQKDEKSRKRMYSLTEKGKEFVIPLVHSMKEFIQIVQEMIDTHGDL
ncbi:MAG: PadR family transcriptional regulator [Candidatus Hermodarchaeota archaeon]